MSVPLEQTIRGKAGVEYTRADIPVLGGWNADANDGSLAKSEFSEVKNLRIHKHSELEIRTGYLEFDLAGARHPICTCEYLLNDKTWDCVFYELSGQVYLHIRDGNGNVAPGMLKNNLSSGADVQIPLASPGPTSVVSPFPIAWACQYNSFLVLSLYNTPATKGSELTTGASGLWALWPANNDLTGTWTVMRIGKDLATVPRVINYLAETTGPLFLFDSKLGQIGFANVDSESFDPQYDLGDPVPRRIPVPISARYWLSGSNFIGPSTTPYPTMDGTQAGIHDHTLDSPISASALRLWEWGANDPSSNFPINNPSHPQTRGWSYRFVFVQSIVDPNGQKYKFRSNPSVDQPVRNSVYSPPHFEPMPLAIYIGADRSGLSNGKYVGPGDIDAQYTYLFRDSNGNVVSPAAHFVPGRIEVEQLQQALINFSHSDTSPPYGLPNFILGQLSKPVTSRSDNYIRINNQQVYWIDVPASELKHAPLTIFSSDDFNLTGFGTVETIEIFRTAHSEPGDKDNIDKDPLFVEHKYGYVGTIKIPKAGEPANTFTDDIADTALDFGRPPEDENGFLKGQMAGQVMRVWNNELVIGNTEDRYWVFQPTPNIQAYFYDSSTGPFIPGRFSTAAPTGPAPDGRPFSEIWYSYVDTDGNESTPTNVIPSPLTPLINTNLSITFPRGYSSGVITIKVYFTDHNGTSRITYLGGTFKEPGTESANFTSFGTVISAGLPTQTTKLTDNPGALLWSKPNGIFDWPPINFELRHQFAPIRYMDVVTGPLWVLTDRNVTLTELNGKAEEEDAYHGAIGRFCSAKVDKVIFFLSQHGVYYAEASGVVPYPAFVNTAILKYLDEKIPGQEMLANASRAAMGWLGQRKELWLYFPSSTDLYPAGSTYMAGTGADGVVNFDGVATPVAGATLAGTVYTLTRDVNATVVYMKTGVTINSNGHLLNMSLVAALPHRLFIFKHLGGNVADVQNYEFDVTEGFEILENSLSPILADDYTTYRSDRLIFSGHADGDLWCSYFDRVNTRLATLNNDVPNSIWLGGTWLEKRWGMSMPNRNMMSYSPSEVALVKIMRQLMWRIRGQCTQTVITGNSRSDGLKSRSKGVINLSARIFNVTLLGLGMPETLKHIVQGPTYETTGRSPASRWVTRPNNGQHSVVYQSMDLFLNLLHNHP